MSFACRPVVSIISRSLMRLSVMGLVLTLVLPLAGCSLLQPHKPTQEMKSAVFNVAKQYLEFIVRNDYNSLQQMISWPDFHEHGIKETGVYKQLQATKGRWVGNEHPLVALKVVSLDIEEDRAKIVLQKSEQADAPEISIVMIWNGRGWLIVGDSIFGPKALFAPSA